MSTPLTGDLGLGAWSLEGSAPGQRSRLRALPYAYADIGRFFAREDTVGARLWPLGWGAIELVARVSSEGADSAGPRTPSRHDPRPVGLGTFQETPWGGVFLDAFGDPVSGGNLLEASYAVEVDAGPVSVYPQLGVARRSARYVRHLYGVSVAQAEATGQAVYMPGSATTPTLSLAGELIVAPGWALVANLQREWFDGAIDRSPRVDRRGQTSLLIALARHFD